MHCSKIQHISTQFMIISSDADLFDYFACTLASAVILLFPPFWNRKTRIYNHLTTWLVTRTRKVNPLSLPLATKIKAILWHFLPLSPFSWSITQLLAPLSWYLALTVIALGEVSQETCCRSPLCWKQTTRESNQVSQKAVVTLNIVRRGWFC
jgi:hypothetical protein